MNDFAGTTLNDEGAEQKTLAALDKKSVTKKPRRYGFFPRLLATARLE